MQSSTARQIISATRALYDSIAARFSASRDQLWDDLKPLTLLVKDGDLILDLGCGNGRLLELFQNKKIHYIGADFSPALIAIAKERNADEIKNNRAGFTVASATATPFDNRQFNVVFSIAVLHHIPSASLREEALKEMHRILKPGGVLALTVWNLRTPEAIARYKIASQLERPPNGWDVGDVEIPWKETKARRYVHAFKEDELKNIVGKNGFKILEMRQTAGNIIVVANCV
ncbi:MAG: methyltransferase protein [Candidatus Magasanikbacteria bacterium]|nr:methyltransferase protein [Candidatus Magasanikbacteria bacterium]